MGHSAGRLSYIKATALEKKMYLPGNLSKEGLDSEYGYQRERESMK